MQAQASHKSLKPLLVGEAEAETLKSESLDMPSVTLSQRQLCDVELMMNGGFTPLDGFMDRESYAHVLDSMRLPGGELWPIPVTLDVGRESAETIASASRVALRDQEGLILAVLDVSDTWEPDKRTEAQLVYGTTSERHPGVRHLHERIGDVYVGGRILGVQLPTHYDYQELRHSPRELSRFFDRLGWRRIIAFHTSRPMHKRERELTLQAAREVRGHLLLHPVVGVTMHRDLSHFARIKCYQEILRHYPQQLAALSLLPLAVRGAGPREALWHAIIRRNYGCTDFIVERDHASPAHPAIAGSEDFYPSHAAQELAREFESELGISIFSANRLGYSPKARRFVPIGNGEIPEEDSVPFGDAELAARISHEEEVPDWFTYPEVIDRLRTVYPPPREQGITLFFTGLSGSGKSTLAKIMYGKFIEEGRRSVTLLDGDIVRHHLSSELGFSKAHRDINVRRIGFVASEITKNGGVAICAPIAPYAGTRRDVREMVEAHGSMIEIYVCTPLEVCEARDRKGLYAKARKGIIPEFTGISDPYEEPEHPELTIDTTDLTPMQAAQEIFLHLFAKGYLDPRT
ncbi:MAG: bifunctional sulfate adenylyltransferase/adenylylsulfate kinase [Thiotrichales bacterium]|nr:bifunctional sulfate adenylyltransferase/adenylylsulfate kinase [Thiotrichales bacterium]